MIKKDEDQMNLEKDDTDFLEQVLEQLKNADMEEEKKINIESYERIEHLDKACKNEKLQESLMCSIGSCTKIFGGLAHLKHHYRKCNPNAIFEMDYPNEVPTKKGEAAKPSYIKREQERVSNFLKQKKQWIKTDVTFAQ